MLDQELIIYIASFAIIALAAQKIGQYFSKANLPKITGYLVAGVITGPFVLGFIPKESLERLRFVDEISLAIIAFAAGNELFLPELKGRLKSIGWVTAGSLIAPFLLTGLALFLISGQVPFLQGMLTPNRIAVAMLTGAILVARSPSSAIAVVNELRAKGPYTRIILGVTVLTDVFVIALFAFSVSVADALLTQVNLDVTFVFLLIGELILSLLLGYVVFQLINLLLLWQIWMPLKAGLLLALGWSVFFVSGFIREYSHQNLPFEVLIEPLLVCMVAGFLVTNYGRDRIGFDRLLHVIAPFIYIAFFSLTGASLKLNVLLSVWPIALVLFFVRLFAMMVGSFTGGVIAGDPAQHNRLKWMGFVTQAGVALGLAKEVAGEFSEFGDDLATLIIAVVVINEIVGPIFFKFAINRVGEAHTRAPHMPFDGVRDAIIFGVDDQAIAVARQLTTHGWQVKLACLDQAYMNSMNGVDIDVFGVTQVDEQALRALDLPRADAVVSMLSDKENLQICQLVYEKFGTETVVVRLNDRAFLERFHDLGALVVDPGTAMVSLLDQFVRSPTAVSLFLGMEPDQNMVDVEVRDRRLDGVMLRDLRLPLDTLILSIHRDGHTIISHGYTRLKVGDKVTLVGSMPSLDEVMLRFDA